MFSRRKTQLKNTLILAALSAAVVANAAPVLIYSTSFESPAFSPLFTVSTPGALPGFLGGQGAITGGVTNRPWALPLFSQFTLGQHSIVNGVAASGDQSVLVDTDESVFFGTSEIAVRPIDSTQSPSAATQGVNTGLVIVRAKAWFSQTASKSGFGIGFGEFPGISSLPTSEYGALIIGGNSSVYLRTGQSTTIGVNLRKSTLPALAANTWHDLTLVALPTSRSVYGYVNGVTAFGTASSPTGVTAASLSGSSPINSDIGQFRFPVHAFGGLATSVGVSAGGGSNSVAIDDFTSYKLDANSVMVTATLNGYLGSTSGRSVDVQLRPGGAAAPTIATTYFPGNTVVASAPAAGTYDVWVKPKGALATVINSVSVQLFGSYFLNTNHVIGDVDGDNEIGPGDFELINAEFGNANPDIDADGDGEVGPSDFEIVVTNFGIEGAP